MATRLGRRGAAGLALALLAAAAGRATVVEELTVARAVRLSARVVVGVVGEVRTERVTPRSIVTESRVVIEAVLAGAGRAGDEILVRHPGGRVQDLGLEVEGMPVFTPGERVLLFLIPTPDGSGFRTLGLYQGAYSVIVSASGVETAVQKPGGGARVVPAGGAQGMPAGGAGRLPQEAPLADLVRMIRAELP
jgi:hypothetical protein